MCEITLLSHLILVRYCSISCLCNMLNTIEGHLTGLIRFRHQKQKLKQEAESKHSSWDRMLFLLGSMGNSEGNYRGPIMFSWLPHKCTLHCSIQTQTLAFGSVLFSYILLGLCLCSPYWTSPNNARKEIIFRAWPMIYQSVHVAHQQERPISFSDEPLAEPLRDGCFLHCIKGCHRY